MQSAKDYLKGVPLIEVFHTFPTMHSVSVNDSVGEAAKLLAVRNLYSLPVLRDGQCVGLVDFSDLLDALCNIVGEVNEENAKEKITNAIAYGKTFVELSVGSVMNASGKNPYISVPLSGSIYDAVELLANGAQRLPLVDEGNNVLTIISPSLVIKHLAHVISEPSLHCILSQALGDGSNKDVVTVPPEMSVIEAAHLMRKSGLTSVGIVEEGNLISALSLKDFKCLHSPESFVKLFQTVDSFVSDIRQHTSKAIFPAIHCTPEHTLENILLRLAATGIHRMFVVQPGTRRPVGIISLRDILKLIVESSDSN